MRDDIEKATFAQPSDKLINAQQICDVQPSLAKVAPNAKQTVEEVEPKGRDNMRRKSGKGRVNAHF